MIFALLSLMAIGQPFTCKVVSVHDGDGPFHCSSGVSIRLSGVQAPDFTNTEPCRKGRAEFVCGDRGAAQSRDRTIALIQGRTLSCVAKGKSYKRTVAACTLDGADLSCLAIKRGIASRWARYDRRGDLVPCQRQSGFSEFVQRLMLKQ